MALRDRLAARPEKPEIWRDTEENISLCKAALRGESVSHALLGFSEARRCVISGIRHHDSFARSTDVVSLCSQLPENADLARARHARLLMSNDRPDMPDESTYPYCIWSPEVPSVDTCRWLAAEYPALSYHVGRACAVAGYVKLYEELDLLPDISIAEEARDAYETGGGEGCDEIFKMIVDSPVRFAIMDDYTRTVNLENPHPGAFLNGDSQVCSSLLAGAQEDVDPTFRWHDALDITEDGGVARPEIARPLRPDEIKLLQMPLPADLPTTNKDLLILMAAYEGNVDRYARLRRPFMLEDEPMCLIRGIYHSTSFARWWLDELETQDPPAKALQGSRLLCASLLRAVTARHIMCNDLTVADRTKSDPYMIWYPLRPRESTLAELARRRPQMVKAVAHACIVADYARTYDALPDFDPDPALYAAAKLSLNKHYRKDLERRAVERGWDPALSELSNSYKDYYNARLGTVQRDMEPTSNELCAELTENLMYVDYEDAVYDGGQANSKLVDVFLCSPEELREKTARYEGRWAYLHVPMVDDAGNLETISSL